MVLITPPRAESRSAELSDSGVALGAAATASAGTLLEFTFDDAVAILDQGASPPPHGATPKPPATPGPALSQGTTLAAKPIDLWADTVEEVPTPHEFVAPVQKSAEMNQPPEATAAIPGAAAELSSAVEVGPPQEAAAAAPPTEWNEPTAEPPLPSDVWISPAAQAWPQWILLGSAAVMGIALAIGVFGYAVMYATRANRFTVAEATPPSEPDRNVAASPAAEAKSPAHETAANSETTPALESPDTADASPIEQDQSSSTTSTAPAPSLPQPETVAEEEANPPPPVSETAESPFDATGSEPPLAELAANADLLEKFGDFLGGSPLAPDTAASEAPRETAAEPPPADSLPAVSDESEADSAATPLPRPAPRKVDVAARLADPIAEVEFAAIPLGEFLNFVTDLSTVPISIEPEALAWRRLTPATPIAVRLADTTVEGLLTSALTPLGLGLAVNEGHAVVTTLADRDGVLRQITHPVEDLTGGNAQKLVELGEMIVRLVAPESWKSAGGAGSLAATGNGLSIDQTEAVHYRVIVFCETLRTARGMAPRTRFDPGLFQPQAQQSAAQARLATSVTLNFRQPTELTTILDAFGKAAGVTFLVDWRAAADVGWTPEVKASVVADGASLADTLTRLLTPLDLTYRVVDGATLEITTPERLRTQIETSFFPVKDLLKKFTAESLVARLQQELGESRFADGRSQFQVDEPSLRLIAALPPPQQTELAGLLETLRKP
jgi:hypothetical protein